MKNLFKLLWSNTFGRFFSVLGITWLIYQICNQTGIFSLNNSGVYGLFALLTVAGLISTLIHLYNIIKTEGGLFVSDSDISGITKRLKERTGTVFSQIVSEKRFIDHSHKYTLLHRQDLLDHSSGHFNSFRHIKGVNVSGKVSDGLIYCESTEYKVPFTESRIEAFDLSTGTPASLRVESLKDIHERCITHAFKIHFRQPLQPGESFDIAYSIFLPNELKCLDPNNEVMSISLVRIKQPIKDLTFNVCLEFNPRSYKVYKESGLTKKMQLIDSSDISVEAYTPQTELERKFNIAWSTTQPYIIRWKCSSPKSKLFVVEYAR